MTDTDHMNWIDEVRRRDLATLREKERTYKGSWKASGGRSAWFMLRRKIDRLLNMLAPPPCLENFELGAGVQMTPEQVDWLERKLRAEDVFAMIDADPSGADGTVLAEIRDLRCYLTLVEAEMIARGVVPSSVPASPKMEIQTIPGRTPEDGGHYATVYPWIVAKPKWPAMYENAGRDLYKLCLSCHDKLHPSLLNYYRSFIQDTGAIVWILDLSIVHPDARDYFPYPSIEVESGQLPYLGDMALLYGPTPEGKYKLKEEFVSWSEYAE